MASLSVAFSPLLFERYETQGAIAVVIDVLRATSAISAAFESGVEAVVPVETLEEAREWKKKGFLVGAERDGQKIPEFDFGNSPYDYIDPALRGKTTVLTTTNGTRALHLAGKTAGMVICASFVNLGAVIDWLSAQDRDVVILCSGWKDRFNLEDSMCAGAIVEGLFKCRQFTEFNDSALASRYLYQAAKANTFKVLRSSSHGRRLARLNLKRDIRYSLTPDQSNIIPVLKGDRLVAMPR